LMSVFTDEESNIAGDAPIQIELEPNDMKIIVWES
jgi:hypothetical protein